MAHLHSQAVLISWFKDRLERNLDYVCNNLELDELLIKLRSYGALTPHQMDKIKKIQTNRSELEARYELQDIISRTGPQNYARFIHGLLNTKQYHVVQVLLPEFDIQGYIDSHEPTAGDASMSTQTISDMISDLAERTNRLTIEVEEMESEEEGSEEPQDPWTSASQVANLPAISAKNEKFYSKELAAYPQVEPTCGVIENLTVDTVDAIKPMLFDGDDNYYPNFSEPKGPCLIINNRNFKSKDLGDRQGTDIDMKNMKHLFTALGYTVKIKENLTISEMKNQLDKLAKKNKDVLTKCHSVVVVILTHGDHGMLHGVNGGLVSIELLVQALNSQNCPELINKPKLFFIQACRGKSYDPGVLRDCPDGGQVSCFGAGAGDERSQSGMKRLPSPEYTLEELLARIQAADEADAKYLDRKMTPSNADILIAYATTPGYVSWRNSVRGSWFIQATCEIFCQHARKEHILDMLTMVNRMVSEKISQSGFVQVPEPCSRLRRKFYFFPGVTENNYKTHIRVGQDSPQAVPVQNGTLHS